MPEPFPLPTESSIVRAAAGWAHCVSVTGNIWISHTEFFKIKISQLDSGKMYHKKLTQSIDLQIIGSST